MKKHLCLLLLIAVIMTTTACGSLNSMAENVKAANEQAEDVQTVITEVEDRIKKIEDTLKDIQNENERLASQIEALIDMNGKQPNLAAEKTTGDDIEHSASSVKSTESEVTLSPDELWEVQVSFGETNLSFFDFMENVFFMDTYSNLEFRNFDYTQNMVELKDSLIVYEKRSKDMGKYDEILDYGVGLIMDAIVPYSSILLLFTDEEEVEERDSNDLMMEVNYNIQNGKNAGMKQVEFMNEIAHYYKLESEWKLTETDVVNFLNAFIDYYENDLSNLATIYYNEAKVEYMISVFMEKTGGVFSEEEARKNFNEKMDRITTSVKRLDALYNKIKVYKAK